MWVPGHTGVDGNEEADQLANKGSETHFIGPEPFFGYSSMKYNSNKRPRQKLKPLLAS
jgi:ribonuclease HI